MEDQTGSGDRRSKIVQLLKQSRPARKRTASAKSPPATPAPSACDVRHVTGDVHITVVTSCGLTDDELRRVKRRLRMATIG